MKQITLNIRMNNPTNNEQVTVGSFNIDNETLINALVDHCQTEELLKMIKVRLIDNAKSEKPVHLNDLKKFLNLMKLD